MKFFIRKCLVLVDKDRAIALISENYYSQNALSHTFAKINFPLYATFSTAINEFFGILNFILWSFLTKSFLFNNYINLNNRYSQNNRFLLESEVDSSIEKNR